MTALHRTLGSIRSDIQSRLGFGMAGEAGVVNASLIDSFIRSAQKQLYEDFEWKRLVTYQERTLGMEQTLYDYATDCEPENILSIAIRINSQWSPLTEGITWDMRSVIGSGQPTRFERYEQLEIWPAPNSPYTLRYYYQRSCGPLNSDTDRTTIDSELVFLHALVAAKLHYRQPDAQQVASQLETLVTKLKARNRRKTVYKRQQPVDTLPFPKVVGRD